MMERDFAGMIGVSPEIQRPHYPLRGHGHAMSTAGIFGVTVGVTSRDRVRQGRVSDLIGHPQQNAGRGVAVLAGKLFAAGLVLDSQMRWWPVRASVAECYKGWCRALMDDGIQSVHGGVRADRLPVRHGGRHAPCRTNRRVTRVPPSRGRLEKQVNAPVPITRSLLRVRDSAASVVPCPPNLGNPTTPVIRKLRCSCSQHRFSPRDSETLAEGCPSRERQRGAALWRTCHSLIDPHARAGCVRRLPINEPQPVWIPYDACPRRRHDTRGRRRETSA
jgi:hypothetical protein